MARRPVRGLAALAALLLLIVSCQGDGASVPDATPEASTARPTTSSTNTLLVTTTTTTTATPSTIAPETTTSLSGLPEFAADIRIPDGNGTFPSVVLVHGGAWVVGSPTSIEPLAIYLSENGFLTVNAPYHLSLQAPGFPLALDDIACAVRFAANHPRSDGTVTVVGHSAGAHVGALVALTGDDYGADCPYPGSGVPDRFIGLAGPYDVARLGPIMLRFFGETPEEAPEDWEAGNPQLQTDRNPLLKSLLIHGDSDQVVPVDFSTRFFEALEDSGGDAELIVLDGVEHNGVRDPSVIGELVLDWLGK